MQISVIIVSYNVKHYLTQCLHALIASMKDIEGEIFVVDNASNDGSVAFLKEQFPNAVYPFFHLIANTDNRGFGQANNQAALRAKGKYILYLNPDTIVTERTLKDCLTFAEQKEDFGALGVKMLADDGKFALESRRGIPTPWRALCKILGITSLFPHSKSFGGYYQTYQSKEIPQAIEIISGAFMLVKKEHPLTLFDDDFFMYGEDIDLSYRLLKAQKQNYYLPTPIVHYKGESTHRSNYRYVHVFYQAIHVFYQKHFASSLRVLNFPIKVTIIVQAICSLLKLYLREFLKYLSPNASYQRETFLYLGKNREDIEQMAFTHGLRIDIAPQLELSKLLSVFNHNLAKYKYVIFDLACYPYSEILNYLENNERKYFLATYHPATKTLITGKKVYSSLA